jgi:hypothetical protein
MSLVTTLPFFRSLSSAVVLFAISGCAIGNKHNYRDVIATLPTTSGVNVAVATHDQRPYVLDNDKSPAFVGLQRGGYGNPFDVENLGGEPLSSSFSSSVCSSIKASAGTCTVVTTQPSDQMDALKERLVATQAPRSVLFTLREWKSDTMMNTALHYNVTMDVFSPNGALLLTRRIQGVDDLRGSFWNAPGYAKRAVPGAFKAKLEGLLGDAQVMAALSPGGSHVAKPLAKRSQAVEGGGTPSASECSVSQVLEMKKIGLSDAQIKKTCP